MQIVFSMFYCLFVTIIQDVLASMGHIVSNVSVKHIDERTALQLAELVSFHGAIVLENEEILNTEDLLKFASKFGEPINLPNGFGGRIGDNDMSYVTHISNIDPHTGIASNVTNAEYLHNDGDFWQNNHIFSILYGQTIPKRGGGTQFIDSHLAYEHLKRFHSTDIMEQIEGRQVVVDVHGIPDFQNSVFLDQFSDEHAIARHDMVTCHPSTGHSVLYYGCKYSQIEGFTEAQSYDVLDEIDGILMKLPQISYAHEWKPNTVVIWDNIRVMHRSMGGFDAEPRHLLRVQSRIDGSLCQT